MNFLTNTYYKSLSETEKNIRFWEDYLNHLKALDFAVFANQLKVPVLVPIGSRIFFRGELKHTNEVTVALGADYFVKCSLKQAEVLRQHRIKDAQSKLDTYQKEKEYIKNQISFNKDNVYNYPGQEVIEIHTAEEDKEWREKHRENVKKYKQRERKVHENVETQCTDEELWNRLEELELQEELDRELQKDDSDSSADSFIVKEEHNLSPQKEQPTKEKEKTTELSANDDTYSNHTSYDILQRVLDKQNDLEEKLIELRSKARSKSRTESDLISRLDEMEQLDELEDDMDRLENIIQTEDHASDEETSTSSRASQNRRVSFADAEETETLRLTFTHSNVEPSQEPYNAEKGILKPSDIYKAYSYLFSAETTSILKKTKYGKDTSPDFCDMPVEKKPRAVSFQDVEIAENEVGNVEVNRTIIVKDVVESDQSVNKLKTGACVSKLETGARPTSLFKKRRQQI